MIISPDARNQIDGSVQKNILAYLPDDLPLTIVPISWFPDFVFRSPWSSPAYQRADKGYILIDFMETHAPQLAYDSFWQWVSDNPPLLTFRRELRASERLERVIPIEWPVYLPIPDKVSKEQFDSRPIEVLYFWGMSNRQRPILHGEIFSKGMANHGIDVISEWIEPTMEQCLHEHYWWATIFTPYWRRKPINEVSEIWMKHSKITVSMPGNGMKTFRDTECVGTLMAIRKSDIAYSYPWNETNSIQLEPGNEFESLLEATKRTNLYDLYLSCDANMRNYEAKTYVRDYVLVEIQKVL